MSLRLRWRLSEAKERLVSQSKAKEAVLCCSIAPWLLGFAENIREGYQSCATCHVSPSGGQLLNDYGRAAGNEALNIYKYDQPEISPFQVGFDSRYLMTNTVHFPMQLEAEIGVTYAGVTGVLAGGLYGSDRRFSSRSGFVKYVVDGFSIRYGRFMPNYGIRLADHSRPIIRRAGLDQGQESLNAELHYVSKYGEATITRILGTPDLEYMGYVDKYDRNEWVFKTAAYIGDHVQVGMSKATSKAMGIHLLAGYHWIYTKLQYDWHDEPVGYMELGGVLTKGLHLVYYGDLVGESFEPAVGFKAFPITHLDVVGRFGRDSMSIVGHVYW